MIASIMIARMMRIIDTKHKNLHGFSINNGKNTITADIIIQKIIYFIRSPGVPRFSINQNEKRKPMMINK
jgi:hypothetical protein